MEGEETADGQERAKTDEVDTADDTIDGRERASEVEAPRLVAPDPDDFLGLVEVQRSHYTFIRVIKHGGMGRVFEAHDRRVGRVVAIKELLPRNRDLAAHFEAEARITARLQHPSIIHVYEAGRWPGGEPFYVMNKVAGRRLGEVVKGKTLAERLGLIPNVIAVADALAYAHSEHVIHRDLKPSNVLVGPFGETVVIDWGLAKDVSSSDDPSASGRLTRRLQQSEGSVVGTPAYMPPEQARGEVVDERADVYALGAILYEVLVGEPPYGRKATARKLIERVIAGPPPAVSEREPGAPDDLVAIVTQAMARDPEDRYPTARELAVDLGRFQTGQLVAARHYSRRQLLKRFVRRHRVALGALSLMLVLGAVGIVSIVIERNTATAERNKATAKQLEAERRRTALLEERGRIELLEGRAGPAFAYLDGASAGGVRTGALAFLRAEAARPFEAQVASLKAGSGQILVAYRPSGTDIATASADGLVKLWDAHGQPGRELGRRGRVRSLAWSPTEALIATAGDDDGVVRLWSVDDGQVRELRGHTRAINSIEFSHDGRRLVTASADTTARVWDVATGSSIVLDGLHTGEVTTASFSPDGLRVATASNEVAYVWMPSLWSAFLMPEASIQPLRVHAGAIRVVRWSPDGTRILTAGDDGTAQIWDPELGKQVSEPIRHERSARIQDADWSRDGQRILTAGDDRSVRISNLLEQLTEPTVFETGRLRHMDAVLATRWYEDRWIATAGNDRVARLWTANGDLVATFEHFDAVTSLAFSPDGHTLVTGCRDGTAAIWDLQRFASRNDRDLASPIRTFSVTREGVVIAGTEDSHVTLWPEQVDRSAAHLGRVYTTAASSDGSTFASAGEGRLVVWSVGTPRPMWSVDFEGAVHALAFSPDGKTLLSGNRDGLMQRWDVRDGRLCGSANTTSPINALAYTPDGSLIVGATDARVYIWDSDGNLRKSDDKKVGIKSVAFQPSSLRLVLGGKAESVIVQLNPRTWELEDRTQLEHAGEINAVVVTAEGLVITGGDEGIVRIWDIQSGKLLSTRDPNGGAIYALGFLPGKRLLWTGTQDGIARSWELQLMGAPLPPSMRLQVGWRLDNDDVARLRSLGEKW